VLLLPLGPTTGSKLTVEKGRSPTDTKTTPLSRLETNLQATLLDCANSGQVVVVKLPDERLIAIQSLETTEDDSLVDDLLESNHEFRSLLVKSKASARKTSPPAP
jgi:hypothetical protein